MPNLLTKTKFKTRWESGPSGGGITFDEVADCAIAWGISSRPKTQAMGLVLYKVLLAAGVKGAKKYKPKE